MLTDQMKMDVAQHIVEQINLNAKIRNALIRN